jgi:membrane associated rhomboid family serine protease
VIGAGGARQRAPRHDGVFHPQNRQRRVLDPRTGCKREGCCPPFCYSGAHSPGGGRLAAAVAAAYLAVRRCLVTQPLDERRPSEPIFNVPPIVIATVGVLVLVHAFRMFALSPAEDEQFLLTFAFIPARYSTTPMAGAFPGGFGADLWTFFTYAFLHADLLHIGLNLAWLIPFGTAIARRFGAWRYVLFMLVTAAAGALAQLIGSPQEAAPMIGASAAISGTMAAAMRFIFQPHGPLETWRDGAGDGEAYRVPAVPLLATFRDVRFLLFLGVWMGLNALFGLGAVSFGNEAGQLIAWQAHIGGFLAGLVLFTAFDPAVPRGEELDTEPSA